jgi:class 3 adenylate cyclase
MQRRLAAILAADVVGYSRLMGSDEMGTLTSLKSHRRALVDPAIAEHRGRIVKTPGDGMLVEFASVVDAVACAVKVQRSMVGRNADVPEDKQIIFRIGINVGDIIIDGDDILAMASISRRGWKRYANPAASASRGRPTTRSGTSSRWLSQTSASKP